MLDDETLKEIYRRIHTEQDQHGAFLTLLGGAAVHADNTNFASLRPLLCELVQKYRLLGEGPIKLYAEKFPEDPNCEMLKAFAYRCTLKDGVEVYEFFAIEGTTILSLLTTFPTERELLKFCPIAWHRPNRLPLN